MIPIRNKRKTLQVTVDEMRNFAFAYVEKYAPSKQQLKTYLLKKYMKLSATDSRKKDVNKLIDIVLSDLEKNKFINDQFYSESKAKSMIQRGNSLNKITFENFNFIDEIYLGIRPEDISIKNDREIKLDVKIDLIENLGFEKIIYAKLSENQIIIKSSEDISNKPLTISFSKDKVLFFDRNKNRIR